MYGSPQIWALSKTLTVTASLVLAFLFAPSVYAGDLGGIDSVTHGGKTITQGETVYRSDFGSVSNNWTFNFSWPNSVGNTNAMLAVIRGTFGSIAGGTPQSGVNFDANFQAWSSGTNSVTKSIGMPPLGGLIAQSDTYTVLVAQTNGTFNQSGTMQWFASGGTLGQEPVNYKLLTFTYSAADVPTQLPGALNSVQYGPRSISAGEAVPQEDVVPNAGNPSQYWRFSFVWPNAVPNQQALVVVFKGTYGALDGGAPAFGVNYAANLQAWAAGANTIGKSMALPGLESDGVEGVYTVLIAERDPKFSSNSTDQEVQWFASGGTQGVAPRKYTTLTFTLTNPPKCCSSVLFLPGFMASRLYKDGEKLWEPGLFTDSTQLLLDETGHPV
ncbi:MAG: hypothetical protein NBV63_00890, partial [Candidatus Pacebacteria bacterium]|nr:hypothetical protein [Candidatus Paceibacterota bacterium]